MPRVVFSFFLLCGLLSEGVEGAMAGIPTVARNTTMVQEYCQMSNENDCSLTSLQHDYHKETIYVKPPPGSGSTCLNGSPYQFTVSPGDPDNVLLYFQGGGACWDNLNFVIMPTCTTKAKKHAQRGVFNRNDVRNPYRTWTVVEVLYCTGDLHIGNAKKKYDNFLFKNTVQHKGSMNSDLVLDWLIAEKLNLNTFVLMGNSAGSLAVQSLAQFILTGVNYRKAVVVMDSLAGIPTAKRAGAIMKEQGVCQNTRVMNGNVTLTNMCLQGKLQFPPILENVMQKFPNVSFLAINSKADLVQIAFHNMLGDPMTGPRYYNELVTLYRRYSTFPNFISYLVDGTQHVFTKYHIFYDTYPFISLGSRYGMSLIEMLSSLPVAPGKSLASQCHGHITDTKASLRMRECALVVTNARIEGTLSN